MKQYFNFKGFYSIVLMALVDAEYRFIWASVGAPVNTHDSTLFQSTELWGRIVDGNAIPNIVQKVNDVDISPQILGDGASIWCTQNLDYGTTRRRCFIKRKKILQL